MTADGPHTPPGDPRDAAFDTSEIRKGIGRRTGNTSVLLLAMSGLRTFQQMAAIAIMARLIPPAEYGIFALAMPGVLLTMALSNFGLPQAIVQRREIDHETVSALFWVNALFGVIAMGVVIALAWPAAQHFDEPRVIPVYHILSISVLLSAIGGQYQAILRRMMRVSESVVVPFIADLLGFFVAVIAALAGMSYWALVLDKLVGQLFTTVALVRIVGWKPSSPRDIRFGKARGAIAFGGYVAGYSLVNRFTEYAGTMIAGSFAPADRRFINW